MNEPSKYDLVAKDLFQRDHPSLLDHLTGGVAVREILNVELARVEERRADSDGTDVGLVPFDGTAQNGVKDYRTSEDPFYRNPFVVEAVQRGHVKVIRKQLGLKFGKLPKWVDDRLDEATPVEIERWHEKILFADTFEGVLGKRAS